MAGSGLVTLNVTGVLSQLGPAGLAVICTWAGRGCTSTTNGPTVSGQPVVLLVTATKISWVPTGSRLLRSSLNSIWVPVVPLLQV